MGSKLLKKQDREILFRKLSESIPEPKSDLHYQNHFQLLIAVMLSAQATDVSVNKVTPALFQAAPTPAKMVALGEEGVREHIRTIGLYNSKAKNIVLTCQILVDQYHSQIPATRKELEALPGVGTKTAGVVLNVAFDQPTIPVDTHVFRLSNRLGLVATKSPNQTEKELLLVVPKWALKTAHHLLILHGRYICKARNPQCGQCCVSTECLYPEKRL